MILAHKLPARLVLPLCLWPLIVILMASPAFGATRKVLTPQVPTPVSHLTPVANLRPSLRLNLAISLPTRDQPSLATFLQQLYDPASPNYHHYLTPDQFVSRFGPTERDYAAIIAFAKTNGLSITRRHPNRLLLDVNASVQEIEKAFHIRMQVYEHPNEPRTFYSPDVQPSLDLDVPIISIAGLDNYTLPRPMHRQVSPTPNVGSAPGGGYMGNDFRNAYAPSVPLTGAGQTVALVQFDGFYETDINAYTALAGLPNVPLQTVLLDGYDGVPSVPQGNLEVSLGHRNGHFHGPRPFENSGL